MHRFLKEEGELKESPQHLALYLYQAFTKYVLNTKLTKMNKELIFQMNRVKTGKHLTSQQFQHKNLLGLVLKV